MITNLLIGLPNDRPGGLVLTVLFFVAAAASALVAGWGYALVTVVFPRASLGLQAAVTVLRGIPLLLLLFLIVQATGVPLAVGGLLGLLIYSFTHVGETLRSFLASYPIHVSQQARVLGLHPIREWLQLRIPWTFGNALDALGTHWISLLKDTGALVVLGVAELTTVAKVLGETTASFSNWMIALVAAAAIYLAATLLLIHGLGHLKRMKVVRGFA